MRDFALTVFILGSLPLIVVRPYIGILMFAWIGYMNPHRFTWGFAYSMPFALLVGGATILGFLFTKEKDKIPIDLMMFVWIAWIVWMNISTVFALNMDTAIGEWDRAMKIQLTSLLALSLMQSEKKLNLLVWVVALSVGFFGIKGGIFVVLTGGNYLVWGPPDTFFEGNNGLAVALLMVMPLFWYLRSQAKAKWVQLALLVAMILIGFSILGSYSRGALLGIVAVCIYLVYKSRHRLILLPVLIVAGAISVTMLPDKWFERAESIQTYEEDRSAMGRINAWKFGFNLAKARPLTGGGYGAYTPRLFQKYAPIPEDFHDAHSIYFEVLGEQGFVGLLLFLWLGWLAFRKANRIRARTRNVQELQWAFDLVTMVQVCLVGYVVAGAFVGLAYFDLYYHLLAIVVLTNILVDRKLDSAPDEVESDIKFQALSAGVGRQSGLSR